MLLNLCATKAIFNHRNSLRLKLHILFLYAHTYFLSYLLAHTTMLYSIALETFFIVKLHKEEGLILSSGTDVIWGLHHAMYLGEICPIVLL